MLPAGFMLLFFLLMSQAQTATAQIVKPDDPGKTYYDSSYNLVYEVFHYLLEYHFMTDEHDKKKFVKAVSIKDGPYISYHPNGKIASTGYFMQDEKDSLWKYYSIDGKLLKTELYREQQLVP